MTTASGPLFNDLESKSLIETQHWFASCEADRDCRVIGICANQLRQQSRANAMPAVLRFRRWCKLRRCTRFVGRPSEPGGAQQSPIFLSCATDAALAFRRRAATAQDLVSLAFQQTENHTLGHFFCEEFAPRRPFHRIPRWLDGPRLRHRTFCSRAPLGASHTAPRDYGKRSRQLTRFFV